MSSAGNWNTSAAHGIKYHFGEQSTYTKFTVPHSESTIRRLSMVIRVSPQFDEFGTLSSSVRIKF